LKGTRFIWLKNPENLTDRQRDRLVELERVAGLKTMRAYMLKYFAWMLRRHEDGILAYFECRIDNGAVEAMNNIAKAISHRTRGFRTENAFTLAMYHCLGRLQLPETWHKFA
ncbi:MAG: transposase, partial [Actinobacteria bacterium]|nr:transposase [Actinomycetota bacterium]